MFFPSMNYYAFLFQYYFNILVSSVVSFVSVVRACVIVFFTQNKLVYKAGKFKIQYRF